MQISIESRIVPSDGFCCEAAATATREGMNDFDVSQSFAARPDIFGVVPHACNYLQDYNLLSKLTWSAPVSLQWLQTGSDERRVEIRHRMVLFRG